MRRPLLLTSSAAAVLAAAVLLSGCTTPNPVTSPSPSGGTAGGSPSATTSPEPSTSPSTSPPTPVDIACDALVTPQAMYDFNPNYSLLASWAPGAGTPAAEAVAAEGVACRWKNDTSGETIDISVASLGGDALEDKASHAGSTAPYGYFQTIDGVGVATSIDGPYWLVLRSAAFFEPGDAQALVDGAVSALP